MTDPLHIGMPDLSVDLLPQMANRHGLIAGATGTGKTVTLQVMAEYFSRIGVPVFASDVKGDLSGIAAQGAVSSKLQERLQTMRIEHHQFEAQPVIFWDLKGVHGHPVRTTISEMGPVLLTRLLGLSDVQEGVLHIAFKVADEQGLLLLDLQDLRSMLAFLSDHASAFSSMYGSISSRSVGAIQRSLLTLESQGGDVFFGEPAISLHDFMRVDYRGHGFISILDAREIIHTPRLYSTFLLWFLSELFEQLPEVGDVEKPVLAFFFDEAHLLFQDTSSALQEKILQVVRLIRSKGVGVYFVTQNPLDIPDPVLAQLGNRVQHALRVFTPREQKVVKAVAETFRQNPAISTEEAITNLGTGEALVSFLNEKGKPSPVEQTLIIPPRSRMGVLEDVVRQEMISRSPVRGVYDTAVDRESAHELLSQRAEEALRLETLEKQQKEQAKEHKRSSRKDTPLEAMVKSASRAIGSQIGRQIIRGILGSFKS